MCKRALYRVQHAKASTDIYYLTHRCTHSDKDTRAILTNCS